jgi:hypothetical protein
MHYITNLKTGIGKRRTSLEVPESSMDTISINHNNILESDDVNSMLEGGDSSSVSMSEKNLE